MREHDGFSVPQGCRTRASPLSQVRTRAIKEPAPDDSDGLTAGYGRMLALADLCHRFLTVRYATRGAYR